MNLLLFFNSNLVINSRRFDRGGVFFCKKIILSCLFHFFFYTALTVRIVYACYRWRFKTEREAFFL